MFICGLARAGPVQGIRSAAANSYFLLVARVSSRVLVFLFVSVCLVIPPLLSLFIYLFIQIVHYHQFDSIREFEAGEFW